LELAFDTKKLRSLCENEAAAVRCLGDKVARKLRARLADLRALDCICDLPIYGPAIFDRGQESLQIPLGIGHALLLSANHSSNPLSESGNVDWRQVSRVKILEIT